MSKYTISIRELIFFYDHDTIKQWFMDYNLEDFLTAEEIAVINSRGTWSKERLADKIIDEYYMREIGVETPALFRERVKIKMRRIMEEKLPLIYSASIKYDPMVNVDFVETFSETHQDNGNTTHSINNQTNGSSQSNTSAENGGTSLQINSDTPQGQINKTDILNGKYASSTQANESSTNSTSTDSSTTSGSSTEEGTNQRTDNGARDYTRHQKGNSGVLTTAQVLIKQYRENIIAIDSEILDDLSSMFIGLY